MMASTVKVWDPLVRITHWSLLLLFCLSYISGEQEHWIHIYSGYSIFTLISVRLLWGFVGSKHARFSDFIYSPLAIISYLKGLRNGNAKHYRGHNPAGGIMIVVLLATLFLATLSGMKLYGIEEGLGPFAVPLEPQKPTALTAEYSLKAQQRHEQEEFWEETHETTIKLMLLLIILHVLGVAISGRMHGENLVISMINGKKSDPKKNNHV